MTFVDDAVMPVPVAVEDVTFVGVTTITFEVRAVLVVETVEVAPFDLTGPLTPEVFVVAAFVVDVDPLTTDTGPLAPFVPIVSAAKAMPEETTENVVRTAKNRSFAPSEIMASGS